MLWASSLGPILWIYPEISMDILEILREFGATGGECEGRAEMGAHLATYPWYGPRTALEPLDPSEDHRQRRVVLTCVLVLSFCTTSSPGHLQVRLPVSMRSLGPIL